MYALLAYGIWGFAPIYWKQVERFPAPELLAWRVLASLGVAAILIASLRAWRDLADALRSPRRAGNSVCAALLLAFNWGIFIWAVQHGQILATSLGYFINPLVNVVLGLAILRERLSRVQALAVGIAAIGVAVQTALQGELPWVALALAASFGLYGLVRKLGATAPLVGFGMETLTLAPLAAAYLAGAPVVGVAAASPGTQALVAGSGLLTALPLLAFASAARRLPLSLLGMFQYLAPTLTFLLAIGVYGEPFRFGDAASFACVWMALALSMWEALARTPRPGIVESA